MTDAGDHLFWITSRAAGITALLLASAAVSCGLLMGLRLVRGRNAPDVRAMHEVLSLATLVALAVHALSLLGDSYLRPSLADLTIPFVSGYQRWWTTTGIVAGWSLAVLGLAYYARRRIGTARWRSAHRFTALAWVLGLVHALGEGTDAGQAWFLALCAVAAGPATLLLAVRLARSRSGRRGVDRRVDRNRAARAGDRDAVVAVADGVAVAHRRHRDRREHAATVLGQPDALPAGSGHALRAEGGVEVSGTGRLQGARDRVEGDLADPAPWQLGRAARPRAGVVHPQPAAGPAPQPPCERRPAARPGLADERPLRIHES
jgi:sulfoxide reductase heme-binding subunit YedZ